MSEPMSDDAAKRPCAECGCPVVHQGGILHFEHCDQHQVGDCTICEHEGNKAEIDQLRAELATAKRELNTGIEIEHDAIAEVEIHKAEIDRLKARVRELDRGLEKSETLRLEEIDRLKAELAERMKQTIETDRWGCMFDTQSGRWVR
ncbi:hypothetical protein LCGC14_2544290, partial [marine sediment metagenome]